MDKKFAKAIVKEIKTHLLDGNNVNIKGLGTFSVVHEKQIQKQDDAGRVMLLPPADKIRFTPES